MPSPYSAWRSLESRPVVQLAEKLYAARKIPTRLSPLILMTDPKRLPDPVNVVRAFPGGAAIIYRHFGEGRRVRVAEQLRQVTFERRQQFLIGDDPDLAISVGADGVHFRRDAALTGPVLWRKRCPEWLISMAGLKGQADYSGDLSVLDGLFISSVFDSQSPSSGPAIGIDRFSQAARTMPVPIFALGGINAQTAPALVGSGAAGIAGISGLVQV